MKPASEKKRILQNRTKTYSRLVTAQIVGFKSTCMNLYLAYQPDSQAIFGAHPEFDLLFERFVKTNKINNGGDIPRLWCLLLNLKQTIDEGIEGDFAEVGVWRGNTASVLAHFASRNNRQVFLFDTFEGFSPADIHGIDSSINVANFRDTSMALVADVVGTEIECCHIVKGYFPSSLTDSHTARKYAVVSLDCDLYEPIKAGLQFFYPLMPKGGIFFLHDYSSMHWAGAKLAIDEFCKESSEFIVLMPDKSGSAFLRKTK